MDLEMSDECAMLLIGISLLALWKVIEIVIWISTHLDISISIK
jgi:hypothetical protein